MPQCKLCNDEVANLVRSHITPRAFIVDPSNPGAYIPVVSTSGVTRTLTGHYDRILCLRCERSFDSCDANAVKFVRSLESGNVVLASTGELMFRQYDPTHFSALELIRFGQTLLYRAHKTTCDFYDAVDVGSFYPRLKRLVHEGSVGERDEFSVVLVTVGGALANTTIGPIRNRLGTINTYRFHVPGLSIFVKVDRRPLEIGMRNFMLVPDQPPLAMHHESLNGTATHALSEVLSSNATQIDRILLR